MTGFIYKPVTSPLVAVEEYYVRREIFVANVIARHLRWHEGGLWPTSFEPTRPALIVLSENDAILPSPEVRRSARSLVARSRNVRVLTLPAFRHGGWIANADASRLIGERVKRQYAARSRLPRDAADDAPPKETRLRRLSSWATGSRAMARRRAA